MSVGLWGKICLTMMFSVLSTLLLFVFSRTGRGKVAIDAFVKADGVTIYKHHGNISIGNAYNIFILSKISRQGVEDFFFVKAYCENEQAKTAQCIVLQYKPSGLHVVEVIVSSNKTHYPRIADTGKDVA